jgi:hypothetical protein
MADYESREAAIRFPYSNNDNTMVNPGNQRIACTGAAQTYAIPAAVRGRFCRFRAAGVEVQVSSDDAATSIVLDQVSNAAASTSSAAAGITLLSGEFFDGILQGDATHLCWISRSATGYVEFHFSEQKYT